MNHGRVKALRERLDDFTVSDYHGLKSPGLTCYLNSVLQVLFMTEGFREEIKRHHSKDSATMDPHLERLFADLETKMGTTHPIITKLGITDLYEQRDAAEYFENILRLTSPEASKKFKGELIHKTRCLQCKKGNDSRSNFWILPLVVEESHHQTYSVEQGFRAFFKGEKVCEENVMFCHHCNGKQGAEIDCEITQNPEVLTLLLKRFSIDTKRKCLVKLHCKVDVPQTLNVKSHTYDLYALVNHYGDLTGGHYTAEIKSFETREWYHFNDDIVKMVRKPLLGPGNTHVRSRAAYLLMYRKRSKHSEKTDEGDQEAGAELDVGSEVRDDETERRQDLLHHHQLKDERCNKGKNLNLFNGDLLDKSHDTVLKKQKDSSDELDKQPDQTVARQRPHKEMLFQIDPKALKQKSKFLKTQTNEGHNEQLDANTKAHRCSPDTRETPTEAWRTRRVDSRSKQTLNSHMVRIKADAITWERLDNTVSQVRSRTVSGTSSSSAGHRVNPAGAKGVKNQKDAGAERSKEGKRVKQRTRSDVGVSVGNSSSNWSHVLSNGHSPPSPSRGRGRMNEPTECKFSPGACNKASGLKRNDKTQHPVTAHNRELEATKGEKTANRRNNERQKPWR